MDPAITTSPREDLPFSPSCYRRTQICSSNACNCVPPNTRLRKVNGGVCLQPRSWTMLRNSSGGTSNSWTTDSRLASARYGLEKWSKKLRVPEPRADKNLGDDEQPTTLCVLRQRVVSYLLRIRALDYTAGNLLVRRHSGGYSRVTKRRRYCSSTPGLLLVYSILARLCQVKVGISPLRAASRKRAGHQSTSRNTASRCTPCITAVEC